jgi:DNA-binding transcriptional LysR family regulator
VAQAHSSTLRFAATHALSFTFMPAWLRGLEARTAVGPVTLVSDVLARCEAMLMQGQVQFLLCHAHPATPSELQSQGYPFVCVGADVLVPVSAPDAAGQPRHPWAQATPDAPLPELSYSDESGIGRILRHVHGASLERPLAQSVFTAHLASVLRTMALDGRGVAWLPRTLIADDLACGRLVCATPGAEQIEMEIRLYRDRAPLGQAAEDFWLACTRGLASRPVP